MVKMSQSPLIAPTGLVVMKNENKMTFNPLCAATEKIVTGGSRLYAFVTSIRVTLSLTMSLLSI